MRVLHFYKTYWPDSFGGAERTIDAIARSTASHGVETTVLSLSRDAAANSLTFNGHLAAKARLDLELSSTGFSTEVFARFRAEASRADLIHYHYPWPFMDIVHFTTRPGLPSVVTYHSDIVRQRVLKRLYAPLGERFLRSVDRIVATSPNYLDSSEVLARHLQKTVVIPIGLDDRPAEIDADLLAIWRKRFSRPFFLFAGVLRYYKSLDSLIVAADKVDADIVIVGSGPEEASLKRMTIDLARNNVHFVGSLPDMDKNALLELCCGFVFPSGERSEAFGLSLVEAARSSRPMISTEIGTGTSFINLDGVTGVVVPPSNPPALAEAMNNVLHRPEMAIQWGKAARQRYLERFTLARMGAAYAALYAELLERGR